MSPGNFGKPPYSPLSNKNDAHLNGPSRSDYERSMHVLDNRRSPSPGPSRVRPTYDRYIPNQSTSAYRDEYPNVYRPDPWRYERSYRPRTPSPDHYEPRHADSWAPPNVRASSYNSSYPDRRHPSPPISRNRGRRDIMAERMFEPSEAWKESHVPGTDKLPPFDRYLDGRSRPLSSDRPRDDYSSYYPSGDFYRPYSPPFDRADIRYPRQSDSYRPQYDDSNPWRSSYSPEHSSNPVGNYRRDVRSPTSAIRATHGHADYPDSRYASRDRSVSSSPHSTRLSSPIGQRPGGSHWEPRYRGRSVSRDYATRSPSPRSSVAPRIPSRGRPRSRSSSCSIDSRGVRRDLSIPSPNHQTQALTPGSHSQKPLEAQNVSDSSDGRKKGSVMQTEGLQFTSTVQLTSSPSHTSSQLNTKGPRQSERLPSQLPSHPSLPPRPSVPPPSTSRRRAREGDGRELLGMSSQRLLVDTNSSRGSCSQPTLLHPPISPTVVVDDNMAIQSNLQDEQHQRSVQKSLPLRFPSLPKEQVPHKLPVGGTSDEAEPLSETIDRAPEPQPTDTGDNTSSPILNVVESTAPPSPSSAIPPADTLATQSTRDFDVVINPSDKSLPPQHPSSPLTSENRSVSLETPSPHFPPDVIVAPPQVHLPEEEHIMETPVEPSPKPVEIIIDRVFEPHTAETRSLQEALRVVVAARQQFDRQSRGERINPVLMANRAIAEEPLLTSISPEALINEVVDGEPGKARMGRFRELRPVLVQRVAECREMILEKVQRLQKEYLQLHESWLAHCAHLDSKGQTTTPEEIAAIPGRTTRRSATVLGDAVRSDLEMEQIIASLGNEDLTDPAHLALRNVAKIPDMISVTHGKVTAFFDDTNNVVDDPLTFYDPIPSVITWTDEEQQIFVEKYAAHPKQFGIIAESLPHKTQTQCVQFYYMHKKRLIDFRKVISLYAPGKKRRGGRGTGKKKGNALLTDIRQHDAEVSRDTSSKRGGRKRKGGESRRAPRRSTAPTPQTEPTPLSTPTPDPEGEARPKRRRGATRVTTAAAATTIAETEEADGDATDIEPRPAKRRRGRKPKTPAIVPATPPESSSTLSETRFIDQTESSARRKSTSVHWSDDDRSLFLHLLAQHGDDFKRIAASMPNKTTIQVNAFYLANLTELNLEQVAASAPMRSPTPDGARDDRTDVLQLPGTSIISPNVSVLTHTRVGNDMQPSSTILERQTASGKDTQTYRHLPIPGIFHPPVDGYARISPHSQTAWGQGTGGIAHTESDISMLPSHSSLTMVYSAFPQRSFTYQPEGNPLNVPSSASMDRSMAQTVQGLSLRAADDLAAYLGQHAAPGSGAVVGTTRPLESPT
ncbi:hypothetical protein EW146_g340 [Bondarzewia mesenterica]|uniref:SANT domain-containing protein n=1 Tax=Bondarzewia mesenterica TaxID=1095465 RepID=A0A4V3XGF1_9AGAM|nr:hypothetical protein EW146_g340 [Bondarzewia mesenterica]